MVLCISTWDTWRGFGTTHINMGGLGQWLRNNCETAMPDLTNVPPSSAFYIISTLHCRRHRNNCEAVVWRPVCPTTGTSSVWGKPAHSQGLSWLGWGPPIKVHCFWATTLSTCIWRYLNFRAHMESGGYVWALKNVLAPPPPISKWCELERILAHTIALFIPKEASRNHGTVSRAMWIIHHGPSMQATLQGESDYCSPAQTEMEEIAVNSSNAALLV